MSWEITAALAQAQLQATLARLDAGSTPARVLLFAGDKPAGAPSDVGNHMVEITLAQPAGAIVAGVLKLTPAPGAVPMVLLSGVPRWGLLVSGDGAVLARGTVTDAQHDGDIRITGGITPPGDNSPALYAGGLVGLAETFLT